MTIFFILLFGLSWIGAIPMVVSSYGIVLPATLKLLQILMFFGAGLPQFFAPGEKAVNQKSRNYLKVY